MRITLAILFLFSSLGAEKYNLAICSIFQDEAKYLCEWIEFHQKQGVEHFFLYNNLSQDNYQEKLIPYIDEGLVTLIDVPEKHNTQEEWNTIQCESYMRFIHDYGQECDWCAFLDIDEFLFSPYKYDLRRVLKFYKTAPAVCVNWIMYGTSNVDKIPENEKIAKFLTHRAKLNFKGNFQVKSIVQPSLVEKCTSPHFFIFKNGLHAITENMNPIRGFMSESVSVNTFRINHYWTRDKYYFLNHKIKRRLKWGCNAQEDIENEKELNEVYDPVIAFE